MNYFVFTYATNLVSGYVVWRMWTCYFINKYPGIHRNDFKKLTKEALPVILLTIFCPIPFVGIVTSISNMCDGLYFRYHKPKIVLKIYKFNKIDVGFVPKTVHPKNQEKFLYDFDQIEPHKYTPTPRMNKARSGNFHKQKDNK